MPEPPRFTPGESVRLLYRGRLRRLPAVGRVVAFDDYSVTLDNHGSFHRVRLADIRGVERVDG